MSFLISFSTHSIVTTAPLHPRKKKKKILSSKNCVFVYSWSVCEDVSLTMAAGRHTEHCCPGRLWSRHTRTCPEAEDRYVSHTQHQTRRSRRNNDDDGYSGCSRPDEARLEWPEQFQACALVFLLLLSQRMDLFLRELSFPINPERTTQVTALSPIFNRC